MTYRQSCCFNGNERCLNRDLSARSLQPEQEDHALNGGEEIQAQREVHFARAQRVARSLQVDQVICDGTAPTQVCCGSGECVQYLGANSNP